MDTQLLDIGRDIKRISGTLGLLHPIMSGKVVAGSIDNDNVVCDVLLTLDDNTATEDSESVPTGGVLLSAVSMNNNGVILYPADDSDVVVGAIDGDGNYTLLKCSTLVKYQLTIGSSQLTVVDGNVGVKVGSNTKLTVTDGQVQALVGEQTKLTMTESGHKIEAGGYDLGTVLKNVILHTLAMTVTVPDGVSGTPVNFLDFQNDYEQLAAILV